MIDTARNLIVLSDGTGNSAAAASKTNVWRLYQALDVTDGTQIAAFSDGVGTSNIKPLRILGQALGFGVQLNVLRLYKFLCRNYVPGDQIWAFGFSRGAFTIRVLVGLILNEGLVCWDTEAELDRNALAVYRAFRRDAFPSRLPWVVALRSIRDGWTSLWNSLNRKGSYAQKDEDAPFIEDPLCIKMKEKSEIKRRQVGVRFVGVWDTVAAYGLPIEELTNAVENWIWPLDFKDRSLPEKVEYARQALSLDDDRRTFYPIPWDETKEKELVKNKQPAKDGDVPLDRLRQVWFAGAHASVGGGYPDDGLSLVALGWMIGEARDKGLRFMPSIVAEFAALANPTGRIYDPRSGLGTLYRYQPRDIQKLQGEGNTPLVHGSVMTRIVSGTEGYAPISLPEKINVLPPYGPPVAFTVQAVKEALKKPKPGGKALSQEQWEIQKLVLENTLRVASAVNKIGQRQARFELILDTVWWRRINYFVSLGFVFIGAAFPLTANTIAAGIAGLESYLGIEDVSGSLELRARGPVGAAVDLMIGYLPGFLGPWIAAVRQHPVIAAAVLIGLLLNLRVSAGLQGRIRDRARAAWNAGTRVDYLQPTGLRSAALSLALGFGAFAIVALATWLGPPENAVNIRWVVLFAVGMTAFLALWVYLLKNPPKSINPEEPSFPLNLARNLRTATPAVATYKFVSQRAAPAAFLFLVVLAALLLGNRVAFDLLSTAGVYCTNTINDFGDERLDVSPTFETKSMCQPTGIRLREGLKYRIQIEIQEGEQGEWFDKARRTDVAGFSTDSMPYLIGSPLKRWWRENWFQPIARIGKVGNSEYALRPAAPLPVVGYKKCTIAEEKCETNKPNRTLISDMTPDVTGELFIYVNDAVLALSGQTNMFYQNNSGTAKISVKRILADSIESANEGK